MQLEEVVDPEPGTGQLVVEVKAIGISPIDTYMRSGNYYLLPSLPYTPGFEVSGVVESVGQGVKDWSPGDRVFVYHSVTGTYAAKTLCPESSLYPLPDHLSFAQGAVAPVSYSTAYQALFHRGRAIPGMSILVHGATGGVGLAAVQLALAAGMTVIATGGTEKGRVMVAEQGVQEVLDHTAANYLDKVLVLTAGQGVDLILEMLANVNLGRDLKVLALGGKVVIIGSRGPVEINPREAMTRDASILGMQIRNASEQEKRSIKAALVAGLRNRTLRPVIGQEIPLAEAPRGHRELMESSHHGKIVLIP
jgi:NADPH2:quinone reductase